MKTTSNKHVKNIKLERGMAVAVTTWTEKVQLEPQAKNPDR